MAWIEEFQVTVVGSAVTAAFAALAYAGNSVMERRQEKRKERAGLIAQLQGLAALLDASGALFRLQQERERHGVIRAYTEHSMRKINQVLSEWGSADRAFKSEIVATSRQRELG